MKKELKKLLEKLKIENFDLILENNLVVVGIGNYSDTDMVHVTVFNINKKEKNATMVGGIEDATKLLLYKKLKQLK